MAGRRGTAAAGAGDNKFQRNLVKNIGDADLVLWLKKKSESSKTGDLRRLASVRSASDSELLDPQLLLHLAQHSVPSTADSSPPFELLLSQQQQQQQQQSTPPSPSSSRIQDYKVLMSHTWKQGVAVTVRPSEFCDSATQSTALRAFLGSLYMHGIFKKQNKTKQNKTKTKTKTSKLTL